MENKKDLLLRIQFIALKYMRIFLIHGHSICECFNLTFTFTRDIRAVVKRLRVNIHVLKAIMNFVLLVRAQSLRLAGRICDWIFFCAP